MDIQKLIGSERFTKIIIGVGLVLAALIVFQAGVYVGVHKAGASFGMGDNYYRAFGPEHGGVMFFNEGLSEAHGAAGSIVSTALPRFVVEQMNGTEKVVVLGNGTVIRSMRDATSSSALLPGTFVIVIGEPNTNGEVEANLVRILPPPPGMPGQ